MVSTERLEDIRDNYMGSIKEMAIELLELRDNHATKMAQLDSVMTANEMLDSIRASLREYPDTGGDIEIMSEVERIESEAYERGFKDGMESME